MLLQVSIITLSFIQIFIIALYESSPSIELDNSKTCFILTGPWPLGPADWFSDLSMGEALLVLLKTFQVKRIYHKVNDKYDTILSQALANLDPLATKKIYDANILIHNNSIEGFDGIRL